MNPAHDNLEKILSAAGARLKWSTLLAGLCWWLAVCLGLWLVLFVGDDWLSLPAGLRLPLALGGAAFSGLHLFRKVLLPAWRKQTPERTALMLEKRYGIRENLLINAVQFQRQHLQTDEAIFAGKTIAVSGKLAESVRFGELWDWRALRVWGGAAGAVALLWLGFIAAFPRQFSAAAERYALPLGDTPPPGSFALNLTPAGDVTVLEGGNLDVVLEVQSAAHKSLPNPPVIVWQDQAGFVPPVQTAGESIEMTAAGKKFLHTFAGIQTPFAFRVFAGDSCTRSIQVKVVPSPRLKDALFRVTPPAYTGLKPQTLPGPPAPASVLPGSELEISFKAEPPIESAEWDLDGYTVECKNPGGVWQAATMVTNAGDYAISAPGAGGQQLILARGNVQLLADNPPEVDFVTDDRNRQVQFGQMLTLAVEASDDFGLADVSVIAQSTDDNSDATLVKRWTYVPPGNPGPERESFSFTIDPAVFTSGSTYYLEALANDFRPDGSPARSRPIVLRVKSAADLALPDGDVLGPAFDELQKTAAAQEKSARLTANLKTYLDDLTGRHAVAKQAKAIEAVQDDAINHGRQAAALFAGQPEGQIFSAPLSTLVDQDMARVEDNLRGLPKTAKGELPDQVAGIQSQQEGILEQLLNLLGRIAAARSDKLAPVADGANPNQPPATPTDQQQQLLDQVKDFVADQERILEKSRTLVDKGPEDLTQSPEDPLGELSSEENQWSKFFEEKLTDFSKLPQQDFADASLAQELDSVYQEVQEATNALAQKNIALAVPVEQQGLENAQQLVNNLERWLPDHPDNIKWSMEEPTTPADIAMADLPKNLEDIVGDLIDKEDAMTPDVQDVTSSWMDSADKGVGWSAGDGPISDMSAKGVTGNLLPNQNEIGGRSGEGRNGRSHGQMVSDSAEGKGGQETPTRLDPEPFEQGNVNDSAKDDPGGATGGGKLSGFAGEGLRGPAPPPSSKALPRLAEQQAKIRQQAEALALQLRRYHISSGELESSVNAMQEMENAARKNDGLGVRRAFSQAVSALDDAKQSVDRQVTARNEQDKLPPWMREEIRTGVEDGIPKGYEEMAGEYFRALAEGNTK